MLIRELEFRVQSSNDFWQEADVALCGASVHFEQPTAKNPNRHFFGRYWVALRRPSDLTVWHGGHGADGLDEFEAQAVFDHYVQEYGLKNN